LTKTRWLRVLLAAVTIDLAIYVLLDVPLLAENALDVRQEGWMRLLAALTHLVTAGALLAVARGVVVSRRQSFHDQQALAATASNSTDWLWETDASNRYTYCSAGVADLLGYRPEEVLGRPVEEFATESMPRLTAKLQSSRKPGIPRRDTESAWRHRDGHSVVLRGSVSPILDEDGHVVGLRGSRSLVLERVDPHAADRRRISEAMTTSALRIALQPIVHIADGRLAGAEALSRFNDGRGPDSWFSEARATGQSLELNRLAFTMALAHVSDLPDHAYLSVNAGPELVLDPSFGADLVAAHSSCLPRLVIEITEYEHISDYEAVNKALQPLRALGARIAVDDAGSGYASLIHILELRPDIIKIDRELLTDLDGDSARRSLVTALVLLAVDLGATVTGEGVETAQQMAALELLAVDCAQGYHLARPVTDPRVWRQWWTRDWTHTSVEKAATNL